MKHTKGAWLVLAAFIGHLLGAATGMGLVDVLFKSFPGLVLNVMGVDAEDRYAMFYGHWTAMMIGAVVGSITGIVSGLFAGKKLHETLTSVGSDQVDPKSSDDVL